MDNKLKSSVINTHVILILISLLIGCGTAEIKPDGNISHQFMKGEKAYSEKQYAKAKEHYEIVVKSYPENIAALFKLANISMREKQWNDARKYYTAIIRLKPTHAKAHHNLAMLHLYNAKTHLSYYIANNESFNNQSLGELINAIDSYSKKRPKKQSSLDQLAEAIK